jgi:hypothetical protein
LISLGSGFGDSSISLSSDLSYSPIGLLLSIGPTDVEDMAAE